MCATPYFENLIARLLSGGCLAIRQRHLLRNELLLAAAQICRGVAGSQSHETAADRLGNPGHRPPERWALGRHSSPASFGYQVGLAFVVTRLGSGRTKGRPLLFGHL